GWALAAAMVSAAACGGENVTPPTTPTPAPQTQVFTGTLNINGAATHPFTSQAGGSVTATPTPVDPHVTIRLSLGTWNGASCHIIIANDAAVVSNSVVGTVASAGSLCVRVYDIGQFTGATSYTITALYP